MTFTASDDHSIKVYTNHYHFNIHKQINVLREAILTNTLHDTSPVQTLAISSVNPHTLFSAGQDFTIKELLLLLSLLLILSSLSIEEVDGLVIYYLLVSFGCPNDEV